MNMNSELASNESQSFFRKKTILKESFGTILEDFEILLEFVATEAVFVTGVSHLFPMRMLSQLNRSLSSPISVTLKRPLQKSYPNIHGLYLLLRASGMGVLQKLEGKTILAVDEAVVERWNTLNETEQYFTLLQAWWCRGSEEVFGDYVAGGNDYRYRCLNFFTKIPQEGIRVEKGHKKLDAFKYYPGLHNLALMEQFGFIEIKQREANANQGWAIEQIQSKDFGETLMGSLLDHLGDLENDDAFWCSTETSREKEFKLWKDSIHPHFPELNQLLSFPEHRFQEGIHTFKVSVWKSWRRIAVSGNTRLDQFAATILNAFEFNHGHMYRFTYKSRFGLTSEIDHPYLEDESPAADALCLGDLPLYPNLEIIFLYDFGSNWEFSVVLESIGEETTQTYSQEILETHGKAPSQYGY